MAEKKMGTQTKASMRNGRAKKSGEVYNANHNTLEKTRRGQLHIDETKFELNRYYQFNLPGKRGKLHNYSTSTAGTRRQRHSYIVWHLGRQSYCNCYG